VIDFDEAVRDPANLNHIDPRYDGGDGLHFTAEGYRRLAEAIDLELLRGAARRDQTPYPADSRSILLSKNPIH
jgi:hypothetical protein